jgi:hypothetical protein
MKNIIEVAKSYIGQEEKIKNSGFKNSWFEKLMRAVGFYTGAPWCAFFAKLVWKEAGVDHSLISGSVHKTMMNATKAGNWHVKPVDGALAIWILFKNGKPTKNGHIGVIVYGGVEVFKTVEGNTSKKGSREGEIVGGNIHLFNWREKNGLRLIGFIHPVIK